MKLLFGAKAALPDTEKTLEHWLVKMVRLAIPQWL
jgi:hypothetical protein